MKRTGSAVWKGGLKDGNGALSTESGTLSDVNYSFAKRFGDEAGTNPEELVGAAHAACYSMQLSGVLGQSDLTPDEIRTTAAVTGAMDAGGFTITNVHLTVVAKIPGADESAFRAAAQKAKEICPISKLLNGAIDITLDATLESGVGQRHSDQGIMANIALRTDTPAKYAAPTFW
jgi:osmotically inducible protein OsmC